MASIFLQVAVYPFETAFVWVILPRLRLDLFSLPCVLVDFGSMVRLLVRRCRSRCLRVLDRSSVHVLILLSR